MGFDYTYLCIYKVYAKTVICMYFLVLFTSTAHAWASSATGQRNMSPWEWFNIFSCWLTVFNHNHRRKTELNWTKYFYLLEEEWHWAISHRKRITSSWIKKEVFFPSQLFLLLHFASPNARLFWLVLHPQKILIHSIPILMHFHWLLFWLISYFQDFISRTMKGKL